MSEWRRWVWRKVSALHPDGDPCPGTVATFTYRHYPPRSPSFERCVGLAWCPECRTYSATMVYVPRDRILPSPPTRDGEPLSERTLVDHLARQVRDGVQLW